jgi:predicted Fe-S protein YdhL (DUF1289 family)
MMPLEDPLASPCVRNCTLDEQDMCVGCGRMIGEIMEWSNASPARKREIKDQLPARLRERRRW